MACSAFGSKLLRPLYAAGNEACCWRMKFAWPEIQKRFQKESLPESGAGAEAGISCARKQLTKQNEKRTKTIRKGLMVRD